MKRFLTVGVAVLALAVLGTGVAIGVATAQGDGEGSPEQAFVSKVAAKLGISEEELRTAIAEAQVEMIDEAVAEGKLTSEQAERLGERIEEGRLLGPPGLGGDHPRPGACHRVQRLILGSAAAVLDMEKQELLSELKDGNTLAEVAEAKGFSADEFKVDLLGQVQEDLSALVGEGKITQEQADAVFERIENNIDRIVNAHVGPGCHPCRPGPHLQPDDAGTPPLEEP